MQMTSAKTENLTVVLLGILVLIALGVLLISCVAFALFRSGLSGLSPRSCGTVLTRIHVPHAIATCMALLSTF
jgi:hypothetical protein